MSSPLRTSIRRLWRALTLGIILILLATIPEDPLVSARLAAPVANSVTTQTPGITNCSVPLDHCANALVAPSDYYSRVDYSWIPQPKNSLESSQLAESLRIPPLLRAACMPPNDPSKGEDFMSSVVAKASLLRLIERGPAESIAPDGTQLSSPIQMAFTGTPPIRDKDGIYAGCLTRIAPHWSEVGATPDTSPGWQEVIADVESVPALAGTPGTKGVSNCDHPDGDWDITMAYLMRVWGLAQAEPDSVLGKSRQQLEEDFASRAWLQGGPANIDDTLCDILTVGVPETENHRWMIRTTRYLHNNLLPIISTAGASSDAVSKYDVNGNNDNNANGLTGILNGKISDVLAHDWLEYNSRPYSRYQMLGLLNLYDFGDDSIRTAAGKVLDFLAVKHVSESVDHLRIAPFRRRAEYESANLFQGRTTGPMYQVWMGGLEEPQFIPATGDLEVSTLMVLAASSGYGMPPKPGVDPHPQPWLTDLMLSRDRRDYLEHFNGQGQSETAYGGPDFVITGGGWPTGCPYPNPATLPIPSECPGSGNDPGTVEPEVLIPRRARTGSDDTLGFPSYNDLIHIDPNPSSELICIDRNFACGDSVSVPNQNFLRNDCKVSQDFGVYPFPDGESHYFQDAAYRFDGRCAGAAYAGDCFFVYTGQLSYPQFAHEPKFAYLVTHSCSPGDTDTGLVGALSR